MRKKSASGGQKNNLIQREHIVFSRRFFDFPESKTYEIFHLK